VYGAVGTYILATGYVAPIDNYNAVGVYAQRDPVKSLPGVLAFYQQTSDSNIGPGKASTPLTQSAMSRAFGVEFDESLSAATSCSPCGPSRPRGLQASKTGLDTVGTSHPHYGVFDIVARDPKFSPYLYLTIESAAAAASNATYDQPAWRVGLKWQVPLSARTSNPTTRVDIFSKNMQAGNRSTRRTARLVIMPMGRAESGRISIT